MADPILVTGAAGFIGARFVESCNARELPLISVDHLPFFTSRPEHAGLEFGTRVERDKLAEWLRLENPRVRAIIHLGASTSTLEADEAILKELNLSYSQFLWRWATEQKVPFVYASSAATYGDGSQGYKDDEALLTSLCPLNPYGRSKHQFDLWVLSQETSKRHPPLWSGFKFFNVYGFGEAHKGPMASVAYKAMRQIKESQQVRLFRSHRSGIPDGCQQRDFVHVSDVIQVLWFALEHPIPRGLFNLGTGEARTFLDVASAAFLAVGGVSDIEFIDTPLDIQKQYQYFTQASMGKLRRVGYSKPFLSIEDGIEEYAGRLGYAPRLLDRKKDLKAPSLNP